ncbi:uncharacterized protein LOC135840930 [Planococcus citri]|uniref:uncharacterized protein LOC135840930 n=1 Tax=Planococcus citri TaxID=170843 RepID=UPI0031F7D0B6
MSSYRTHARNYLQGNNTDRYVFLYDAPSLKEIASREIARTIWYSNLSEYLDTKQEEYDGITSSNYHSLYDPYEGDYRKHTKKLLKTSKFPHCIKDVLKNCLNNVCYEIGKWASDFHEILIRDGFIYLLGDYRIEFSEMDPKWCVWSWNGEIDYRKSAQKMLQDNSVTELKKFIVMCAFAMESEIRKFSLDSLPVEFISMVSYSSDPVCFYWICYLKKELHKIPVQSLADFVLHLNPEHTFRFSYDYFWGLLVDDDDEIRVVKDWIHQAYHCWYEVHSNECVVLEHLISTMSWHQQQRLLTEISDKIIIYFGLNSDSSRCALWAWRNSKNQMSPKLFGEILDKLLRQCEWVSNPKTTTVTSAVDAIWDTASDLQRNYVIQTKSDRFIDRFLQFPCLEKFSRKYIPLLPLDKRMQLIFQKVDQCFFHTYDLRLLRNLMDLCLPCSDDQLMFRKFIINSARFKEDLHCLLSGRCFDEFNEKLKFFFSNDASARQLFKVEFLKKEFTEFNDDIRFITDLHIWNEFSKDIDKAFENDSTAGLKLQQWFISTMASALHKNPNNYFSLRNGFDNLVKIVEMVFVNDELNDVKRLFFNSFRWLSTDPQYNFARFNYYYDMFNRTFMQWCSVGSTIEYNVMLPPAFK